MALLADREKVKVPGKKGRTARTGTRTNRRGNTSVDEIDDSIIKGTNVRIDTKLGDFNTGSKDYTYHSETENAIKDWGNVVNKNNETIRKRLEKTIAQKGQDKYVCPFCANTGNRKDGTFSTLQVAKRHIKQEHRMQVQVLKHNKAPKETYEPKKERQITAADRIRAIVHPAMAKQMEMSARNIEATAHTREILADLTSTHGTKRGFIPEQYLMKPESEVISSLPKLSIDHIRKLAFAADMRSKRQITRACYKEIRDRESRESAAVNTPTREVKTKKGKTILLPR